MLINSNCRRKFDEKKSDYNFFGFKSLCKINVLVLYIKITSDINLSFNLGDINIKLPRNFISVVKLKWMEDNLYL